MAPEAYPCPSCGATAVFDPATQKLVCEYCHHAQAIAVRDAPITELDYQAHLAKLSDDAARVEVLLMKCSTCGAATTLQENQTAGRCPFCDSPIISQARSERLLKPQSLLPFAITQAQARDAYAKWTRGLWFAPSAFTSKAKLDQKLAGLYVPYWTYDARTFSQYTGMRGDDYWTAKTVRINGKTRTRRVKKTRWRSVRGHVAVDFNDVLVLASESIERKFAHALEPWDLPNLVPYDGKFLSGFVAQSYQVDLPEGFQHAKVTMEGVIKRHIRHDIGGDHQRISAVDSIYDDVTFKHILLPVWLANYRYHGKVYRVQINARTGEVQGQRPWSYWKISAAAVVVLAIVIVVILLIASFVSGGGSSSPFHGHGQFSPRFHHSF